MKKYWREISLLILIILIAIGIYYPNIWRYKAEPKQKPERGYETVAVINSITGCRAVYHDVQEDETRSLKGCWFRSKKLAQATTSTRDRRRETRERM